MKRKVKTDTGVWAYLEATGALNGTVETINLSRKIYSREYKRKWRKEHRKKEKEFTPSFTRDEVKLITEAARKHKMSMTRYIKTIAVASTHKIYIVPDEQEVRRISQLLAMNYNLIKEMRDEEKISPVNAHVLLEKISALEHEVLIRLRHPDSLEEWIQKELTKHPEKRDNIKNLLQHLTLHQHPCE